MLAIPLFWFNLLSWIAGFVITLALVWKKPRSIWVLVVLAVVLFVLFGIFAIPGFILALGARVLLAAKHTPKPKSTRKEKKALKRL